MQTKQYQKYTLPGVDGPQELLNMQKGQNLGKNQVKNTKSPMLRPIFHLKHCKSINGRKDGCANNAILKMYFERRRSSQTCKKGKIWVHLRQKYKITNFQTNLPFLALFQSLYYPPTPYKVHFWYFLVVKPFLGPFMESITFQMENWPQNS